MFNPLIYANSRPNGVAVLEVPPDAKRREARPWFVPLKLTTVNGRWDGPVAEITVTHTYGFTKAQRRTVVEALYRFPLPGDAAVRKVVVTFGDVEIVAELKERQQAEVDYAEAKRQGQQAALVTRESPDVFTLRLAGLRPDEDVVVETTYVQLASPEGTGWTLRIPLTTPPRYSRPDEMGSTAARGQPLLTFRDPGHRFALDLLASSAGTVESATHELEAADEDGNLRVRLRDREVVPDRDCVLVWRPTQERDRPSLHLLLGEDRPAGQTYFLALVAPPAVHDPDRSVPREAIALVDHSGSMGGPKWQAADWATLKFLGDLTERDRYNLGVFHSVTRWLDRVPRRGGGNAVADGERFLSPTDSGGTELGVALEQALGQRRAPGEASRQVVLITDAEVTDYGRILGLVDDEARRPDRRRVSILCVDAAPNSFLAQEIARRGGGIARFLTSQPDEGDITTALDDILAGWVQPVLAGLRLEANRPSVEAPERDPLPAGEPGWSALDLGELVAGRSIWVAGRVPTGDADLAFRLAGGDREPVEAWRTKAKVVNNGALKALFGAWRVLGLEALLQSQPSGDELRQGLARLGYDPESVLAGDGAGRKSRYAENVALEATRALGDLLLREALDYGLLCSATGFVAVRKEKGRPVEETVVVGNALPTGWSADVTTRALPPGAQAMAPAPATPDVTAMSGAFDREAAEEPGPLLSPRRAESRGGFLRRALGRPSARARFDMALEVPRESAQMPGRQGGVTLFSGKLPAFASGLAVLFDTDRDSDAGKLSGDDRFSMLRVRFLDGEPSPESVDPGLVLLLYVGDMAAPVARVRLVDMLRQGGTRPLNVLRRAGERVRLVLADGAGVWSVGAPRLEVTLD